MNDFALRMQRRMIALHDNRLFQAAVIVIIVLSALVIGANTYDVSETGKRVLKALDLSVTVFFLIEILIRISASKGLKNFFRGGWNVFDFTIVTMSLIPIEGSQMVILGRLLRVLRVLRLISFIPELRILLNALVKAIPRMAYVAVFLFVIFYIYGAFGSFLFEDINRELWGDISIAMLTLFRVVTFEDWTDVMYETMAVYPLSWIYYLTFIFFAAFVFLNMMIGIVVDLIQREHASYNLAHEEEGSVELHMKHVEQRLEEIDAKLDRLTRGA
jgi:voltage-gated sodium channel